MALPRFLHSRRMVGATATGAVVLVALAAAVLRLLPLSEPAHEGVPRVVFAAFGQTSDTLYVAPATDPDARTVVDTIEHAQDWGINPSMHQSLIAYTVIPPEVAGSADTPAELWLLDARTREKVRLARDADIRVTPQFVSGGEGIVYRRSDGDLQSIVRVATTGTQARTVLHEERTAFGIIPIGEDAGGSLVFARLSSNGTDVFTKRGTETPRLAFHASDEIAHGWRISPDAESIAFLAPEARAERIVARASVVRLDDGTRIELPDTNSNGEQYGPVWTPDGAKIAVGQEPVTSSSAAVVLLEPGAASDALPPPPQGFDVPVAWNDSGTFLIARTLDGRNSTDAGRETAVVIATSGQRYPVSAPGEVILVGWLPNA